MQLPSSIGKEDFEQCGVCDNCIHPPAEVLLPIVQESLNLEIEVVVEKGNSQTVQESDRFQIGAKVSAPKYNEGEVVTIAGDQVTVVFPNNETRTFLKSYLAVL